MALIVHADFITSIDASVKVMMKDGKIDKNDIPQIVLLVTYLISNSKKLQVAVRDDELLNTINALYEYIMAHYSLFPSDEEQKAEFKAIFDVCVQLALFQPNIKKSIKSILSCFYSKKAVKQVNIEKI